MKIDLHCHTKATKKGDSVKRNVSKESFTKILVDSGVSIVAITNHNYFSLNDYNDFKNFAEASGIQVWPGVELDAVISGESGHLLLIGNPDEVGKFDAKLNEILSNKDPNTFNIGYIELCKKLQQMDAIIIAHWALQKENGFSDKAISFLKAQLKESIPVLLEPSKLKSVGIMAANGYDAFIGSDVKDWNHYPKDKVPSLKLQIKDFRTFKLLLKKDKNAVDSFINQKQKKEIQITPFLDEGDSTPITMPVYNDVNIVFGGKATGKSKIVKALSDFYKNDGKASSTVFYKATENVEKYDEITKTAIDESMFEKLAVSDCSANIAFIKKFCISDVTTTSKFYKGVKSKIAKGKINKFGFFRAKYSFVDDLTAYNNAVNDLKDIDIAFEKLSNKNLKKYIDKEKYQQLFEILNELKNNAFRKAQDYWIQNKSQYLTQWTIEKMKEIGKIKSGEEALPTNTGLCEFYSSLKKLKNNVDEIEKSFTVKHEVEYDPLGHLPDKFDVYVCKEYYLNPKEKTEKNSEAKFQFQSNKPKKTQITQALNAVLSLKQHAFDENCLKSVSSFINEFSAISSLKDCFFFRTYVVKKEGDAYFPYTPSDGEKSMLQIAHVFADTSKEIFILDEPELSVGHDYINRCIVPKIVELAKLDKTIIISTHDANIAVRTLPLNSIYREYKKTYIGNLFYDKLTCVENKEECTWVEKSLNYLEGGRDAFSERGDSYGI